MLEYLLVLLLGFWLGVAIFLYVSCYWIEEILDLPPAQSAPGAGGHASSGASGAHAQLKRLVARVVEEAAALPALARYAAAPSPTPTIESSTYEDLLATAILNKVIERYQTENGSGGRSSGIHSASASPSPSDRSSPRSLNSRNAREVSPQLRDEDDVSDWEEGEAIEDAVELPRRVPFPEFGGDIVHQDNEDRDFDEISSSDIQAADGSWEENWLFQKKKIKTIQSVPVPMLVPNSNTEYRALIGDRDAEDTTDLSDNASDAEEQTSEFKSNIKNVLDSKHIIGGKAKVDELLIDDFEPDSLMILDEHVEIDKSYNESKENEHNFNTSKVNIENNEEKSVKDIDNDDRKDSILLLDVESGPPPKAEFNLNEEIHRSIFNGNQVGQLIDLNTSETMTEDSLDGIDHVTNSRSCADGTTNTLSRHERVGEYEETITVPVQRYADSLRRQHYDTEDKECPIVENDKGEDLIPGTIAYRERKKWLNYVEMPNNPYSPEAIQKRLSAKSASSLFDSLTSKSKDFEVPNHKSPSNCTMNEEEVKIIEKKHNGSVNGNINDEMYLLDMNVNLPDTDDNKDKIPSPKTLKHVLSEEIPQHKRYGRDYYIKEAKTSSGARKAGSLSDSSSVSSMRKSTSLDNIDTEFASPVSASSSLSDLEASALHHNIVRAFLSPRNASPNFAINPIFENPDRQSDNSDVYRATDRRTVGRNVRQQSKTVCSRGDGYVENEDIVRLRIPKIPEITEDLFEPYTNVRRSSTLKSEDLCIRSKRRPGLNYTFGGSLRLNKAFHKDLW